MTILEFIDDMLSLSYEHRVILQAIKTVEKGNSSYEEIYELCQELNKIVSLDKNQELLSCLYNFEPSKSIKHIFICSNCEHIQQEISTNNDKVGWECKMCSTINENDNKHILPDIAKKSKRAYWFDNRFSI